MEANLGTWLRRIAVAGGAVLAFITSVSPKDATSRIAEWAEFIGFDRIPPLLATGLADAVFRGIGLGILAGLLAYWTLGVLWKQPKTQSVGDPRTLMERWYAGEWEFVYPNDIRRKQKQALLDWNQRSSGEDREAAY